MESTTGSMLHCKTLRPEHLPHIFHDGVVKIPWHENVWNSIGPYLLEGCESLYTSWRRKAVARLTQGLASAKNSTRLSEYRTLDQTRRLRRTEPCVTHLLYCFHELWRQKRSLSAPPSLSLDLFPPSPSPGSFDLGRVSTTVLCGVGDYWESV